MLAFILKGCAVENLRSKNTNKLKLGMYGILKVSFGLREKKIVVNFVDEVSEQPKLGENVSVSEFRSIPTLQSASSLGATSTNRKLIEWKTRCHTTSVLQILWLTQIFEKKHIFEKKKHHPQFTNLFALHQGAKA